MIPDDLLPILPKEMCPLDVKMERRLFASVVLAREPIRSMAETNLAKLIAADLPVQSDFLKHAIAQYKAGFGALPGDAYQEFIPKAGSDIEMNTAFLNEVNCPTTSGSYGGAFDSLLEEVKDEIQKTYVRWSAQEAISIFGGKIFNQGKKNQFKLKGIDDFIRYTDAFLRKMPYYDAKIRDNAFLTAENPVYLAYPYWALGEVGIVGGASEVGKSNTLLYCIARRNWFNSRLQTQTEYDTYYFSELPDKEIHDRMESFHLTIDARTHIISHQHHIQEDWKVFFRKAITGSTPKLVIIDTIGSWLSINVSKDDQVRDSILFFRQLAHNTASSIVLVSHTRKRPNNRRDWGTDQALDDVAGSRNLYGLANSAILFSEVCQDNKKVKGWGQVTFFKKREINPIFYQIDGLDGVIRWHEDCPFLEEEEEKTYSLVDGPADKILKALELYGPLGNKDLVEKTGIMDRTIQRNLKKLIGTGKVIADGEPNSPNRKYRLADGLNNLEDLI